MRFTQDDVQRFAQWSGDHNPLHVDPESARRSFFGRPVVHGMLTSIRALASEALPAQAFTRLDIEFRGAVFTETSCRVESATSGAAHTLTVHGDGAPLMVIQVDGGREADSRPDLAWVADARAKAGALPGTRTAPADLDTDALEPGRDIIGVYRTGDLPDPYGPASPAFALRARVLALCSYVVGMELPGLRSLFTRLRLNVEPGAADSPELLYRASIVRFDRQFRILDVRLEVASPDGALVACGDVRSYVRFTPLAIDATAIESYLTEDAARLAGKVVLVTGGTRGLGGAITTALAMAGCHVYASFHRDGPSAAGLAQALASAGRPVEMIEGDAGDPGWCDAARAAILARHGRLDAVVLNACAPPSPVRLGPEFARTFSDYIAANLPLAQVPVASFLPSLAAAGGSIVCISSSFVSDPPAGFGHYVALKEAVEAVVRTGVRETPAVRALIARPPRLQTTWNDTPTGVLGTIPAAHAAARIVNGLAADFSGVEILAEFPPPERRIVEPAQLGDPEFSLAVVASFTSEPLLDGLRFWFKELGVRGDVEVAPYGQILQTVLSPTGGLSRRPGMHVVMLRLRDWLRELPRADAASPDFVRSYLAATAHDLERALRTHRSQASAETLLVLCPSAADDPGFEEALLDATEAGLTARLAALPGLTVVRARDFHPLYDVVDAAISDPVREHIAHIPYQRSYFHALSAIVMRHVFRKLAPARKVVVVDCDNTLWRGVVGEVGPEGVAFDDSHAALHERLVRLAQSGVLVALCSKNEEADVWRVFDTRSDLGLKREHVVTAAINWLPKSANLRSMAERLNLGLDSFVFIDDNPVECAEVRAACPEVLTIEWPLDRARALRLLRHVWELDPRVGTAEDQRRTELYKEEFRRQELQAQTLTFPDFIASLGLVVDIAPLSASDVKRASQLTLRTNQFNFTTRRREEGEVQALLTEGAYEIRTVRVRDRFGDYGLVGLLIAEPRGDEIYADTLLLSCRVLGRGVEHQMLAELGRIAEARGAGLVRLRVEPTRRNTPARSFVETAVPGEFRHTADGVLVALIPAAVAAAMTFEPPDQAGPAIVEDDGKKGPAAADGSGLRSREEQIARTAFELSSPSALTAAIDGKPAAVAAAAGVPSADASFVYEAFATALGLTPDRVREIDALEALGCDSFKIVEITVNLIEKCPSIPGTLLFEHRSVREIARRVVELSAPADVPAPVRTPAPRVAAPGNPPGGDIAVVGMHVRCAGVESLEDLWHLLSSGGVAVERVPHDRRYFLGPLEDTREHFAGLLNDVDRFDAELFGITPREAELMDPQLRLFLEVAWAALEDAGASGADADADTGVFAGIMYGDYGYRANMAASASENPFKCWEGFSLANRVSQVFGFRGPSLAVDTACSSSGTAVHLACRALLSGDCRVAIAGGVNLILDPNRFVQLGRLGILSASGRCLAFGADADGTVLGEGAGVVVLRPLADALERGDRIYGVIKGTGVSTGSGTVGFTAPNPQAQAIAIRRAVRAAGIDPRTITYVETHGTGTALGDPIEVRGLSLAYEDPGLHDPSIRGAHACAIGSIKPNIGHLEAGAGVLGLIKLLLQLHRGTLLPSVTSDAPNPQIPFEHGPFSIQRRLTDWASPVMEQHGATTIVPRRGSLNSFGVGGANAHIIVEEAPPRHIPAPAVERPQHLLALSARTAESLRGRFGELATFLEAHADVSTADVCFSINTGQRHLARRAAVAAHTRDEMVALLRALEGGNEPAATVQGTVARSAAPPRIAFLFTGQGSQYAGMGRDLYASQPVFRASLDRCFELFDGLLDRSLKACMFAAPDSADAARLNATGFTQPALFSLGYALTQLWRSWGIRPDVVMGHSIGEITAMCAAGGLSLEDAATLVAARGGLMQALPPGGAMTSIMTSEARVSAAIAGCLDRVAIAAMNGPAQTVISGEADAVAEIASRFAAEGIKTKPLVVSHAFHSPLMGPMLAEYEKVVRRVRFSAPSTPFVSCVLGRVADAEILMPDYWVRNVIDPVRFTSAIAAADATGVAAFVEMGPQPVLMGMARQCLPDADERLWLPSIRKDGQSWPALLSGLGALYAAGAEVDWRGFDAPYVRSRVTVPPYPFGGKRYWVAAAPVTAAPARAGVSEGTKDTSARAATYEIVWRKAAVPAVRQSDGDWLLLTDDDDFEAAAIAAFDARGARVIRSRWSPDDPDCLREEIAALAPSLRGIIYVPVEADEIANASDGAAVSVERAASLLRALASDGGAGVPLWIATRQAVHAHEDDAAPISLVHAALWGLGRAFALEHPAAWGGLIDLPAAMSAESAADLLAAEIVANGEEDQVALRAGGRYVARLLPQDVQPRRSLSIEPDASYLVTGGFGAVGAHAARWLVRRGARRVVIASRRGLATTGAETLVRELESAGATVTVVKADVSSDADLETLFRVIDTLPPLRGVLHAAGVDETRAVTAGMPGDAERVMAAKVRGAWALHQRTRTSPPDLFVCFSSIASVLGSAERSSYAAANAFLDGLAHERRRLGMRALAVNWGPWDGGGMATPAALQQYSAIGNHGLQPADALRALERLLDADVTQSTVADIDWDLFRPAYEARRRRPLVSEVVPAPASPSSSEATSPGFPWIERLSALPPDGRAAALADLLRQEVAETLGFETAAEVAPESSFQDMGMDSLMSADFAQRLQKRLGIRSTALVFEYPYIEALATSLLGKLALEAPAALEPAFATAGAPSIEDADAFDRLFRSEADMERPPSPGIERYRPELEREIVEFQHRAWPHRRRDWIAPRWRWMFLESAKRLGVEPQVWVHRDRRAVVGHNGAIPVRLKIGPDERPTAWLVDTMVLEEYRSQAIGARLMVEAHEDLPFALSLGQTGQMRAIQLRLGWEQVAPLLTAQLLVRPERVLNGKLPGPAALAAGLGLRAAGVVRGWMQRPQGRVREISRFDASHDALWHAMARDLTCAVRRDASYLNWKYVDQPGQDFLRLELADTEGVRGVVICMMREPDDAYRYRRAFIVDLVAPVSDARVTSDLLHAAIAALTDRGADAILCLHINPLLTASLRHAGFRLREPSRFLLVRPGPLDGPQRARVLRADGWYITHGDSDIDRPW